MTPDDKNIIRSGYCCPDIFAGTRLFLIEEGERFLVATRWQRIGRRKRLADAIELYERTLLYGRN